ncbi:N6-adenine-specific methylase, putative [Plasmodium ovale curtisi]|uniref:N6-adenine-specific methylase, putative n=1 Tax=Plasmodium ovale curtisi TaxID=864141 RepID=A0A1A8WSS7_PLAOA|nr:N6-adenine-specific methylase, putative [Plasmodium ovale curtisi]
MTFFKKLALIIVQINILIVKRKCLYANCSSGEYINVGSSHALVQNTKAENQIKNVPHLRKYFYGFIESRKPNWKHSRESRKCQKFWPFRDGKCSLNKSINVHDDIPIEQEIQHVEPVERDTQFDTPIGKYEELLRNSENLHYGEESVCNKKGKKKSIKKDVYGLPVEKLNIRRLVNSKIKSKYKFCKIKTYRETVNINYRKKKILTIHEGKLKNKKIYSPDTYTRPMMSKVKESLFNILSHLGIFSYSNINVIDVFSGSGNLGIECISRDIQNVTFVDLSINSCRTIYENLKLCNIHHLNNKIIRSDAIELLKNPFKFNIEEKYDLAFFTPPYEQIVYSELIHSIAKSELFERDCLIFIEYPKEIEMLPQKVDNLVGLRNRKFGRTYFALYVLNSTGKYLFSEKRDEFYPLHYNRKQRRQAKCI